MITEELAAMSPHWRRIASLRRDEDPSEAPGIGQPHGSAPIARNSSASGEPTKVSLPPHERAVTPPTLAPRAMHAAPAALAPPPAPITTAVLPAASRERSSSARPAASVL